MPGQLRTLRFVGALVRRSRPDALTVGRAARVGRGAAAERPLAGPAGSPAEVNGGTGGRPETSSGAAKQSQMARRESSLAAPVVDVIPAVEATLPTLVEEIVARHEAPAVTVAPLGYTPEPASRMAEPPDSLAFSLGRPPIPSVSWLGIAPNEPAPASAEPVPASSGMPPVQPVAPVRPVMEASPTGTVMRRAAPYVPPMSRAMPFPSEPEGSPEVSSMSTSPPTPESRASGRDAERLPGLQAGSAALAMLGQISGMLDLGPDYAAALSPAIDPRLMELPPLSVGFVDDGSAEVGGGTVMPESAGLPMFGRPLSVGGAARRRTAASNAIDGDDVEVSPGRDLLLSARIATPNRISQKEQEGPAGTPVLRPGPAAAVPGGPQQILRRPEMPLPPRDRTAVVDGMGIQRSEAGSSPGGSAPSGGSGTTQDDSPHAAGAEPEGQSSPANDVQLLASEVWSLLKRRLADEAERMGR